MEMPNSAAASDGVSKRLFFIWEVYGHWQALSRFLEGRGSHFSKLLCAIERRIQSILVIEFIGRITLDNFSALYHKDLVSGLHRGQAVCHHDTILLFTDLEQILNNRGFCDGVQSRGCF